MPTASQPLIPGSSGELNVVAIGRISTIYQNIENIDASYRYVQEFLGRMYQGKMNIRFLGEQASGMRTDRKTIQEAEELIASGQVDLVIAEDLARIYRNPRHQYNFVQDAVDRGVRIICIGDSLDTADENWELMLGTASLRHGMFIPETRRRVRRTATHTFHNGGMVQRVKFGYRKLTKEEADSGLYGPKGLRIAKLPDCTPIIRTMRERVMEVPNLEALADWLNEQRAPVPSYGRRGRWSGILVANLLRDPILSGTRRFRRVLYKPIFETGKHRRENNPTPEEKFYPELAHMTREEQEQMWAVIGGPKRSTVLASASAIRGHPRSRTLWPGQSATCAGCGGKMWVMDDFLKCENALKRRGKECWNHVLVPIALVRQRMVEWLLKLFDDRPDCRSAFLDAAWEGFQTQRKHADSGTDSIRKEILSLQRQADNLGKAIADGGQLKTLIGQLEITEQRIRELRTLLDRSAGIAASSSDQEQVASNIEPSLKMILEQSHEATDVMRRCFPRFVIQPIQALDSGLVRPRGKLCFAPGSPDGNLADSWVELDFFDPPAHIALVRQCLQLKAGNSRLSYRKLGKQLGTSYMSVKRAFAYSRLMEAEGITHHYRELREKPTNASRWR